VTLRADHVRKAAERTGLLLCGIDEPLRSAGLRRNPAESCEQPWYRGTDSGLRIAAIEPERASLDFHGPELA